jgi:glutaminyl-tRNA synthetase
LSLFEAMKNGDYPEGSHVLRAKIDMSSTNMLMRDPLMYRFTSSSS